MTYDRNDALELDLHGLSPDGRTVGRSSDGMTVFVRGGLPGEHVLVRLTGIRKRMAEAELIRILRRSPEERPAPCPHAEACGGCPWQCLPYGGQLEWKKKLVQDALLRIGRLHLPDEAVRPVLSCGENAEWGYRNKMEFAFGRGEHGETLLGLRSRGSRSVTEVTSCRLQTARTMTVLAAVRDLCRKYNLHAAVSERAPQRSSTRKAAFSSAVRQNDILRFLVVREPCDGGCLVELITLPSPQEAVTLKKLGRELLDGPAGVTGFVHSTRTNPADVAYGEQTVLALGETELAETLHLQGRDVTFTLDHNSFFQVNSRAAELLYNTAADLASLLFDAGRDFRGRECWDIYCGVGDLALTMAPHFSRVCGLESVAQAVKLAAVNAERAGTDTSFRFECGDAAHLERCFRREGVPDLLVTDPPRAGMDEKTVRSILEHRPQRLVLVSCNPATLARDLAMLAPAYCIRAVQPVDLFPQTPHVETVVSLELPS